MNPIFQRQDRDNWRTISTKKLTLTVKSNKNGMRTLKVKFSILMKKTNFCGALTTYFGKETFFVKNKKLIRSLSDSRYLYQ